MDEIELECLGRAQLRGYLLASELLADEAGGCRSLDPGPRREPRIVSHPAGAFDQ